MVLNSNCPQCIVHYKMRIRGCYAIKKLFVGAREMEDRFFSGYKQFKSWIVFLKDQTASWCPVFPPVMGAEFDLWALLHQSKDFSEGRERQHWDQWLQPGPSPSYTSTMNAGMNISFSKEDTGQEIPPWEQIPAVTWHVQNTQYVSEHQRLSVSFYLREEEDCIPCKPHLLQSILASSVISRDTLEVKSVLWGHTVLHGRDTCPDTRDFHQGKGHWDNYELTAVVLHPNNQGFHPGPHGVERRAKIHLGHTD